MKTPPEISLTLRVPRRDEPGGVAFYRQAGDTHRFLSKLAKAIQGGRMPSVDEFNKLIDSILLFVPKDELPGARELILDWSIDQLIVAIQRLTTVYVESLQDDVNAGTLTETPQLVAAVRDVQAMSESLGKEA